jgi:hypothetical protein
MYLTRIGEVPYPLFFLEEGFVKDIIHDYQKAVFFGVSKDQLSISSRDYNGTGEFGDN